MSSLTRHSSSHNHRGYVDRGGSRSQETIHYSSRNHGTRVYVEERGGYRSHTSHYSSHNQCECGKLFNLLGDTVGSDGNMEHPSSVIKIKSL